MGADARTRPHAYRPPVALRTDACRRCSLGPEAAVHARQGSRLGYLLVTLVMVAASAGAAYGLWGWAGAIAVGLAWAGLAWWVWMQERR